MRPLSSKEYRGLLAGVGYCAVGTGDTMQGLCTISLMASANSNQLCKVARARGTTAYLIDDHHAIDPSWLAGVERVGITSGASAPERLVQETADFFVSTCEGYRTGRFCGTAPTVTASPASWRPCIDPTSKALSDKPKNPVP